VPEVSKSYPYDMSRRLRLISDRPRRRLRPLAAVVVAGAAALTSCGGDADAAGHATVLEVRLGRFVIEPGVLEAPEGDLELRVTNVDPGMVHNLVVNGKGTWGLESGQSQTLEMADVTAGEYRMWCDVPGHANMGQVGTLVVHVAAGPAMAPR
jgi:nitrite reductase (NO-forming)